MRVLFLAHSYPRHAGDAAGSFLLRLAVGLRAAGIEVRVLAPAAAGLTPADVIEGVPVRRVRYAPRTWETLAYTGTMAEAVQGSWRSRAALLGLLGSGTAAVAAEARRWRADVVHAHWWFPGALAASMPGALGGRPLVLTMHGSDVRLAAKSAPARALFARVAQRAAAVTAVSRWLCSQATTMAPALRCEVAPMPVAVELFTPREHGDTREGLLFVGRLTVQKGVDALLHALAGMQVATTLTLVGSGPEEASLRALAERLGVAQRVRWLASQPQTALPALYASARMLVIPSREEGLGLVAVEAHLCGTPVVAFASGGLPDVVQHGQDGLLVPPDDVAALAAALDALCADAGRAARLGVAGRATALASFSPAAAATRYGAIYERVHASRG